MSAARSTAYSFELFEVLPWLKVTVAPGLLNVTVGVCGEPLKQSKWSHCGFPRAAPPRRLSRETPLVSRG